MTDILFPELQPAPEVLLARALATRPKRIFSLFSGGDGSLAATHWYMENVPNCEVAHIDTGIGIPATQDFVRETCQRNGWPLTIVRAKEDCGQDYDAIVLKHGFPGPASHRYMYIQLKERAIAQLVRQSKTHKKDKILFLTGIGHGDSSRRSGYAGGEFTVKGAQVWANVLYWQPKSWFSSFIEELGIKRNPVSRDLGMSGECLCGAFAKKNELIAVKFACPKTHARIIALQEKVKEIHGWGWEDQPIVAAHKVKGQGDIFAPLCVGCLKEPARVA